MRLAPAGSLSEHLKHRIAREGPLTVAQFMADCLAHPRWGYYVTRDPLGGDGDFTTAPEISQMFGELIGLWAVVVWRSMGGPDPVLMVELGPGRGTLMGDALRAASRVPEFHDAVRLHLVEASPVLRRRQEKVLAEAAPTWHDGLASVPDGPLILIANEFFDALPIQQFQRTEHGWRERQVAVEEGDRFAFVLGPIAAGDMGLPPELGDVPPGGIVEVGAAGTALAAAIADRSHRDGGAALIVDYGHSHRAAGDTLQAVRQHRYHPVLETPGEADLTAHVDFLGLAETAAARGADVHGPVPLGPFLSALGIKARAKKLMATATPRQNQDIRAALHRLTSPGGMGGLFKALALTAPGLKPPPGFVGAEQA